MTDPRKLAREIISTVPRKRLEILMDMPEYRGERYAKEIFYIGSYPSNRTPRDNSKALQEKFDHVLKSLGLKALRSNSIFVTHFKEYAGAYAENNSLGLRVIIPAGEMHITWSSKVRDLVFTQIIGKYEDLLIFDWECMERNFDKKGFLETIMKHSSFHSVKRFIERDIGPPCNGDIVECLFEMELSKIYEIIRPHNFLLYEFLKLVTPDMSRQIRPCFEFNSRSEFFSTMRKDDLYSALESKNEILMTGDFYYSIDELFFANELAPELEYMIRWTPS